MRATALFQFFDPSRFFTDPENKHPALERLDICNTEKGPSDEHDPRDTDHESDCERATPDHEIRINVENQRKGDKSHKKTEQEPREDGSQRTCMVLVVKPERKHGERENRRKRNCFRQVDL